MQESLADPHSPCSWGKCQDHLGILPNPFPIGAAWQLSAQGCGGLGIERFGVGRVTHLHQPGQVSARGKTGIHAGCDLGRIGIDLIVGHPLSLPGAPRRQFRFLFGQACLVYSCQTLRLEKS